VAQNYRHIVANLSRQIGDGRSRGFLRQGAQNQQNCVISRRFGTPHAPRARVARSPRCNGPRAAVLWMVVAALQLMAAGGALHYDLRFLKLRCCRATSVLDCEYLPVGETSCPAGSTVDNLRAGWECTARGACDSLRRALEMMNDGLIRSDECYHALLEAHQHMPVHTTGRPAADGVGRKCASAVRSNLAVAALLRERDEAGMHRAHRLLTMALLCDDDNAAAFHNLLQLGGQAACADLADHGEPAGAKECESVPGYHLRMLHDAARNDVYKSAIEWALQKRPGARVLDVGAGSGLLAFVAAANSAQRVDALEMVLPVAAVARANVRANAREDLVHVWPVKSYDFPQQALPHALQTSYRADVIVHEIFDPCMLGEGVLPALRDASVRLASENTIFVPHSARAYVHAVDSWQLASHRWPPRLRASGSAGEVDYCVVEAYASAMFRGDAPIIETQNMRSNYALTERVQVLQLDFHSLPAGGGRSEYEASVVASVCPRPPPPLSLPPLLPLLPFVQQFPLLAALSRRFNESSAHFPRGA
jgi:predicted RNA methylase